jgi:hypothetical protein
MYRKELNDRSPLRIFENSIHGGLGRGNIGVVVARHGIGKTAFLVGVALDDVMRGKKVLHVALNKTVDHVREFYDELFLDLAHSAGLENIPQERLEMERNRNIHTYVGKSFTVPKLRHALGFLKEYAHFSPSLVVLQGYDFEHATVGDLNELAGLAKEFEVELWMSATTHRDAPKDGKGIPAPLTHVAEALSVVVRMAHDGKAVHLTLLKDHDSPEVASLPLALDPTTLLLVKE